MSDTGTHAKGDWTVRGLIERAQRSYDYDAEFHALVATTVGALDADQRQRTGKGIADDRIGFARRVAALALTVADMRAEVLAGNAPSGGRCIHCGTSNMKCLNLERERCCPGCSDPWHTAPNGSSAVKS